RAGIGDEAGPCRQGGELDIRICAGDAEAEIQRARTRIKHERGIKEIGLAENASGLHYVQKSDEQQESDAESYHDDQSRSSRGMLLHSCSRHTRFLSFRR